MANDWTGNPIIIDTAFATPQGPFANVTMWIDHFEFVQYAVDADNVVVNRTNGKLLWSDNGAADLRNVESKRIGPAHGGFVVPTLSAGKLLVYLTK